MDWYQKVILRLENIDVSKEDVDSLAEDICRVNGISFTNPDATSENFVVYSILEEVYIREASKFAPLTKISVADGVTTDLSKPVENYTKLSKAWHDKAEQLRADFAIGSGYGILEQKTSVLSSIYYAEEEEPLTAPVVDIREGITGKHIIWDIDDSIILDKVEVYVNGDSEPVYTTTSRYDIKYIYVESEHSGIALTSVKVVKTDDSGRTVDTEILA